MISDYRVFTLVFQVEDDSKMSNLPKIRDEEKESKYGYVYAVSGPGEFISSISFPLSNSF